MAEVLMKGNEALAEAALRAGCRFFSGYPITPQTEILEYLSWRMDEVGGVFIQSESEIAGINMLYGAAAAGARAFSSSSGPGFSLMQEGISYLVAADIPCVLVDVARCGNGLGEIQQGQGDYWLATRGNGHGDTRVMVLAPNSVQENADFMFQAFDLAEKYRHPVLILSDAAIGQMIESVNLPEMHEHDIGKFAWTVKGAKGDEKHRVIANVFYLEGDYDNKLRKKYQAMADNEQRWESMQVQDAEVVIVAYGISSRIAKEAVKVARSRGIKLGLIRPITLFPFPVKSFAALSGACKALLTVEMNALGQLVDDVKVTAKCRFPVYYYGNAFDVPETEDVIQYVQDILAGNAKEVL